MLQRQLEPENQGKIEPGNQEGADNAGEKLELPAGEPAAEGHHEAGQAGECDERRFTDGQQGLDLRIGGDDESGKNRTEQYRLWETAEDPQGGTGEHDQDLDEVENERDRGGDG